MAKGRKTGGKPKGYKAQHTLAKELHRERLRELVCQHLEPLARAQIAHALGVSYMVLRHPDGTYTRATNEEQLNRALAAGSKAFEIFTQAPSTAAFADLMNRALDKPAEQLRVTGADDGPVEHVFRWAMPEPTVTVRQLPPVKKLPGG